MKCRPIKVTHLPTTEQLLLFQLIEKNGNPHQKLICYWPKVADIKQQISK
jgi:hypothetical protein